MTKYHKINSPFKRNMELPHKPLIYNDWTIPEFKLLKDIDWTGREKIDGTNIRVEWNGTTVEFKGRTDKAIIPEHLLIFLKDKFTHKFFNENFDEPSEDIDIVLYGEGTGYKIQKGCKYFNGEKKVDFILFDIKIGNWWLTDADVENKALTSGISYTKTLFVETLETMIQIVKSGFKSNYGDFYAEGIMVKPVIQLFCRNGNRIITKIKHKDFYA